MEAVLFCDCCIPQWMAASAAKEKKQHRKYRTWVMHGYPDVFQSRDRLCLVYRGTVCWGENEWYIYICILYASWITAVCSCVPLCEKCHACVELRGLQGAVGWENCRAVGADAKLKIFMSSWAPVLMSMKNLSLVYEVGQEGQISITTLALWVFLAGGEVMCLEII